MTTIFMYLQIAIIILSSILFLWARLNRETSAFHENFNPAQKAYVAKAGDVTLGDVVSLIPHWVKNGIVDLQPQDGGLILLKRREIPPHISQEQKELFYVLFDGKSTCRLTVPDKELVKQLQKAKEALMAGMENAGSRVFTRASVRSQWQISLLLFLSIALYCYVLLDEIRQYADAMEPFVFVMGTIGISFAIWATLKRVMKKIVQRRHQPKVKTTLAVAGLIAQYTVACGAAVFVAIYLPALLLLALISLCAAVLLTLFYIFVRKYTDVGASLANTLDAQDILYKETWDLYPDKAKCDEIYRLLKNVQGVWDDAETLKIADNNIPVNY